MPTTTVVEYDRPSRLHAKSTLHAPPPPPPPGPPCPPPPPSGSLAVPVIPHTVPYSGKKPNRLFLPVFFFGLTMYITRLSLSVAPATDWG